MRPQLNRVASSKAVIKAMASEIQQLKAKLVGAVWLCWPSATWQASNDLDHAPSSASNLYGTFQSCAGLFSVCSCDCAGAVQCGLTVLLECGCVDLCWMCSAHVVTFQYDSGRFGQHSCMVLCADDVVC
jgi:hypothetical protein